MTFFRTVLTQPISSERTDATVSSILLYVFAVLVLVLGAVKIAPLARSEFEIVMLTLAVVTLSMLMVIFGQLLEVNTRLRQIRLDSENREF